MMIIVFILVTLAITINAQESTVSFKTTIIDSPVDQVIWCGSSIVVTIDDDRVQQDEDVEKEIHEKVVYVVSNKGILYRSLDYGFKWENVTKTLIKKYKLDDDFKFRDVIQSPADSNVVYFQGSQGKGFRTNDCGGRYTQFEYPNKMFGIKLNKMNANQAIAFVEKSCNKSKSNCKDNYKRQLLLTKDGGKSWNVILGQVKEASWDKLVHFLIVPDERIIVAHLLENGTQAVSFSDNFFKTQRTISWDAFGFLQTQSYLFLLVRPDEYSNGYDLQIIPALTGSFNPVELVLPLQDQAKHTFNVLEANDDQVFLSVSHNEDLPKVTNIYVSGGKDISEFTVSLLNNVRSQDSGNCDFQKILGMEGRFIANVYDNAEVEKVKMRRKKATNEKEQKVQRSDNLNSFKRSMITFDQGGDWHPIKAPKVDHLGNPINCNGDCSLHIQGRSSSSLSQIYSSEQAVGIIIATGNKGLYLSTKSEDQNTYLSRDGGHNWFQILRGPYIYEIGDHGGLIVFAKTDQETHKILYTWNEGLEFTELQFVGDFRSIQIDNIVTESSNMEQKFLIYGRQMSNKLGLEELEQTDPIFKNDTSQQLRGVLVALDFTSLHQRVCTGEWDPTMPESDYEYWTPMNYQENKCLLGKRTKYLRRKRDVKCFNPDTVERVAVIEKCQCTEEDFECDFGYFRKVEGGDCVPLTTKFKEAMEVSMIPKKCKDTYMKSQGYRKIPGNQCEGGVDLGPIKTECPNQSDDDDNDVILIEDKKQDQVQNEIGKQEYGLSQQIDQNKELLLLVLILIILFLFKDSLFAIIRKNNSQSNEKNKKKNYYPKTDEEEMRSSDDDRQGS